MNLFNIIADIRVLIAAVKAGTWLGDDGVLAIVQRLLGYFNNRPLIGALPESDEAHKKEFEALCSEFAALKGSQSGVVTETVGVSLGLKSVIFELIQKLLDELKKIID